MNKNMRIGGKIIFFISIPVFIYIISFSYICLLKYISFTYKDWDLAIYSNFCYNSLRGNFFSTLLGTHFFGNHLNFLLFLILPVYYLFSSPYTLLFIQTLFLGLAAYPLYFIVKKELDEHLGFLFVLLYLIHPGINYTNLNEFHPEAFFPFLFFSSFYLLIIRRIKHFFIFIWFCLMLKENFSLVIAAFGLYCIFTDRKKIGFLLFILGVIWFYIAFFIIIPKLNRGVIGYFNIYPDFGNTPFQIMKNVVLQPLTVIKVLFTKRKIIYVTNLLLPLSFTPLLGFKTLILALPLFLQHLLSRRPMEYNIAFYYSSELLPPLFICAVYGIKNIFQFLSLYVKRKVALLILAIGLISSSRIGPLIHLFVNYKDFNVDYVVLQKSKFLELVPKESSVVATFEFLPILSNRKELYSFHYIYTGFSILSKIKYELPHTVEYALVDFNDHKTFSDYYDINNYKNLQKFFLTKDWKVEDYTDTIVLLKKEAGFKFDLCRKISAIPENIGKRIALSIDGAVELVGYDINSTLKSGFLDMTFYWRSLKPTEKDINVFIDIVGGSPNLIMRKIRPICYRVFPTNGWHKGDIFKEQCRIKIPPFYLKGSYKIKMGFFNYCNRQVFKTEAADNLGRISLTEVE